MSKLNHRTDFNRRSADHIHDTLTSGLQLDIEPATFERMRSRFIELQGVNGEHRYFTKKGDERFYKWSFLKKDSGTRNHVRGVSNFWEWKILFKKDGDEIFTMMGLKLRQEGDRHFLNITANPTAIMRCDYATKKVRARPITILTSPFRALTVIAGTLFSKKEWRTIASGDLTLHNIEIAFALDAGELTKDEINLAMFALYGARTRLKNNIVCLADTLGCQFSHFSVTKDNKTKATGIRLHAVDSKANQLFTFTLYDKIAEIDSKGKTILDVERLLWEKNLRADIRVFPVFMHRLAGKKNMHGTRFSLATWIELEEQHENFSKFLLKAVLEHLAFGFLTKSETDVQIFVTDLEKEFGKGLADKWLAEARYKVGDLLQTDDKATEMKFSRLLARHGIPSGIGGYVFVLQRVFNMTADLEKEDILRAIDLTDLDRAVRNKKKKNNFDQWEDLKSRMQILVA